MGIFRLSVLAAVVVFIGVSLGAEPKGQRLPERPEELQDGVLLCGPGTLYLAARLYGHRARLRDVTRELHVEQGPTSIGEMCREAERLGLAPISVSLTTERLRSLRVPCILRLGEEHSIGHFVLLMGMKDGKFQLFDPQISSAAKLMEGARLEEVWDGVAVLLCGTHDKRRAILKKSEGFRILFRWAGV